MSNDFWEGQDVFIPEMGVVHVEEMKPSGSAVVLDTNGVRWLLDRSAFKNAEVCLFRTV